VVRGPTPTCQTLNSKHRQFSLTLALQPQRLIIAPAAVGCTRLILIQASPCDRPIIGRLSQGKCANAQEEDRCDSTTSSTDTIAGSICT
jgi:hypothetical protein